MIRVPAVVIGLFLVAVWIAGLSLNAPAWLTWLDGVGALVAFAVAGTAGRETGRVGSRTTISGVLAVGLFVLWIIGLSTHAASWIVWCTFGAACASAIIAFGGSTRAMERTA